MSVHDGTEQTDKDGCCKRCGRTFPLVDLKRPSIPSFKALAAIVVTTDPDGEPFDWSQLVDDHMYCRVCRARINVARILGALLVCGTILLGISLAYRWLF